MYQVRSKQSLGFTIVELLVVIVVIGVLAAITIVAYSGVSSKATVASLKSDLANSSKQLKLYNVIYGEYPSTLDGSSCPSGPTADTKYCLRLSNGNSVESYSRPTTQTFILTIKNSNRSYEITEASEPHAPIIFTTGGTISTAGEYRVHTFSSNTTITASSSGTITITANGAGGGGAAGSGAAGSSVTTSVSVTSGQSLVISIGQGGLSDVSGGTGGSGYASGGNGGSGGSGYDCLWNTIYAGAGAGGGGSTAVTRSSVRLIEAVGGSGSDGAGDVDCEGTGMGGGPGGAGGGTNYPSLTTQYGGASGGAIGANGSNGSLIIKYPY